MLSASVALAASACGSAGFGAPVDVPGCLTFADLYALTGPESEGFDNWADAQPLATELGSTTQLPDGPLSITAPGEESGTYGSYVEIVVEPIAEMRAAAGHLAEDQVSMTRKDYNPSADDNVIIDSIAGTEGSLGWVGFAYADANRDLVQSLAIDGGKGCVEPTEETIAELDYPISRPLFIYVDVGAARGHPAVAAFVSYYVRDEGRTFAEAGGYISLTEQDWAETQAKWAGLGIDPPADAVDGSVTISGSSTVEPVTALAAEQFNAEQSGVAISVAGPGTSDGFAQFCAGQIPVADASRAIAEEETAQCEDAGIDFVELQIGIDGLSVITRK